MKNKQVIVSGNIATYQQRCGELVCCNSGYTVTFIFDDDWAKVPDKKARFVWNGQYHDKDIDANGVAEIPELHGTDMVEVGVYSDTMRTTTSAVIPCRRSIRDKTDKPHPEHGQSYADQARASAEAAAQSAAHADEALKHTNTSAEIAYVKAYEAEQSAARADGSARAAANSRAAAEQSAASASASASAAAQSAAHAEAVTENTYSRIDRTDKRVTNLERSVYGDLAREVVDDSVAYTKPVPAAAKPYARIDAVGGMTRKCTNLIPFPFELSGFTLNGITVSVDANQNIILNGTCTEVTQAVVVRFALPVGTYAMDAIQPNSYTRVYLIKNGTLIRSHEKTDSPFTFNVESVSDEIRIDLLVLKGGTFSNGVFAVMLNPGTTALPYEPYFEGLRSAPVTEIESVGINKFGGEAMANKIKEVNANATINTEKKTVSYYAGDISDKTLFTDFKPNTRYTMIFKGFGSAGKLNLIVRYTDGTNGDLDNIPTSGASVMRFVSDPSKSVKGIYGIWFDGTTTLYYDECGIFEGVLTADDFKPYVKHTLPTPEAVRNLDGYGEGINKDVNNHIRYEDDGSRTYTPMVKRLVLDGVTYGKKMDTTDNQAGGKSSYYAYPTPETLPILSDAPVVWCGEVGVSTSTVLAVSVKNDILKLGDNPTPAEITNAINAHLNALYVAGKPVEVVYVPAEHTTEDISDILPADNYIGVEGGGTLTMVNEYGYDVPSEVVFVTKEGEA